MAAVAPSSPSLDLLATIQHVIIHHRDSERRDKLTEPLRCLFAGVGPAVVAIQAAFGDAWQNNQLREPNNWDRICAVVDLEYSKAVGGGIVPEESESLSLLGPVSQPEQPLSGVTELDVNVSFVSSLQGPFISAANLRSLCEKIATLPKQFSSYNLTILQNVPQTKNGPLQSPTRTDFEFSLQFSDAERLACFVAEERNVLVELFTLGPSSDCKPPRITFYRPAVLVVNCGGTFSSLPKKENGQLAPQKGQIEPLLREKFKDLRFDYTETEEFIDSANANTEYWLGIVKLVTARCSAAVPSYRGVVVIHGTDTLVYTAAALALLIVVPPIPIIITGSQVELFNVSSDAPINFFGAFLAAYHSPYAGPALPSFPFMPTTFVYFNHQLFRGCRVRKCDTSKFDAFEAVNSNPVAILCGRHFDFKPKFAIKLTLDLIKKEARAWLQHSLSHKIGLIRLYPGITAQEITLLLKEKDGLVVQAYGAGNGPVATLKDVVTDGKPIVFCTECYSGSVSGTYEASLGELPFMISGVDMTPEVALVKFAVCLSRREESLQRLKRKMAVSWKGEVTSTNPIRHSD